MAKKELPYEPDDASADTPYKPVVPGSGIRVSKSAPMKKSPKDIGIFTQEDLQKYGGKLKEPPADLMPPVRKAKGGKIDGCAQRGKTRGKVI